MTNPQSMPASAPLPSGAVIRPQVFHPPPRGPALLQIQIAWLPLLVGAALALWGWAAWFAFTARSVSLAVVPTTAHIEVADWLAPRLGQHWLLQPGLHRVTANAAGYKDFDAFITIDDAAMQTRAITLERLPGRLRVSLGPKIEAEVLIDNRKLGMAPGVVSDVPAGARQLEIRARRYRSFITQIEIEGKGLEQSLSVGLEPAWAAYSIASQPSGAQLSIDGQPLGNTPSSGEMIEGRRIVKLSLAGYKPWQQALKVVAGAPVKLGTVVLNEADGQLQLSSTPVGASVTLDDNFVGRTPLNLAIAAGTAHRLHVLAEGYLPAERGVQLAAAASETLVVTLEAELAKLQFITTPSDAELLVDGEARGSANQTLDLPTREHDITVRARGYATYTTKVTPRKNVEKRYTIRLKTIAEAAAEQPLPVVAADGGDARADEPAGAEASPVTAVVSSFAGQQLKLFSAGLALLGSSRSDPARRADEMERTVMLRRAFYLGTKEVSNAEFRRFLSNHHSSVLGEASLDADSQPVVDIDWPTAALYCNWLSRHDGLPVFYQIKFGAVLGVNPAATGYRLPTEAEWEWAARATPHGTAMIYAWGDRYPPTSLSSNYADEAAHSVAKNILRGLRDGFAVSAPIGSFAPNQHGLYDLGGNVAEWVHDYYAAPLPDRGTVDSLGPPSGTQHVIKDASWAQSSASDLRYAARRRGEGGRNDLGFRLARYAQ